MGHGWLYSQSLHTRQLNQLLVGTGEFCRPLQQVSLSGWGLRKVEQPVAIPGSIQLGWLCLESPQPCLLQALIS